MQVDTLREKSGLEGQVAQWPILDMLYWLHQSKKTAAMKVKGPVYDAWVLFKRGELVYCSQGTELGETALTALVKQTSGSFWVTAIDSSSMGRNIERGTEELLLRCAVSIDEAHRLVA